MADQTDLAGNNPLLSAILGHIASGGSINVQGPLPGTQSGPGAPGGGDPGMQMQMGPPPPPPPPMNFTDFATRPENGMKVQGALSTQPNQPTPFNHPPTPPLSVFNPSPNLLPLNTSSQTPPPPFTPQPSTAQPSVPSQAASSTPAVVSASAQPQQSTPSAQSAAAPMMTPDQYFAANPQLAAHPIAQTKWGKALLFLTSAAAGAAGGMHGDPLAGVNFARGVQEYNNSIPDINQARYEANVIKPIQQAAQLRDIESQTEERTGLGKKATALAEADTPLPVTAEQAAAIGMPKLEGTMMTARDLAKLSGVASTNATRVTVGAGHDATRKQIADEKPIQRDDHYLSIMEKPSSQRTPQDNAFVQAYLNWVQTTKTEPGVQRAIAGAQARPVTIVDPNDPDNALFDTAGHAMRSGASSTASTGFQTRKSLAKDFTSGPDAKSLNSLNTAYGHLDQLHQLTGALGNGDVQLVNRFKQEYAKQTGNPAPSDFNAVRDAVAGEVSKTFKGGGATDSEIKEINSTINSAQSPQQLQGVIQQYQGLLNSKRQSLQEQYTAGQQGRPNFQGESPLSGKSGGKQTAPDGTVVTNAQGQKMVKRNGQWVAQ